MMYTFFLFVNINLPPQMHLLTHAHFIHTKQLHDSQLKRKDTGAVLVSVVLEL